MTQAAQRFETPAEITNYFDQKKLVPGFSWLDVFGEEHAHAFTVAKAVETELLGAFQNTLSGAIKDGLTFEEWKKQLEPELKRLGWWGPRLVSDPSGIDPAKEVNFSSPRRLRTIFQSSMRSARAAGQWQRIQRTKRALPYILYVRTSAAEPRQEHLAFEGIILPADDPFWATHFPPNGWGCKCSVRQITAREAKSLGYDPGESGPQIVWREFRNRRTGIVTRVPEGIDPGWHTNPGLARAKGLTDRLNLELVDAGPQLADRMVRSFWSSVERDVMVELPERGVSLPAGVSTALAGELAAKGALVTVFGETARSKLARGETRQQALDQLPNVIGRGEIIDEQGKEDHRTLIWNDGKRWWLAVVLKARTGFLRVVSFRQASTKQVESRKRQFGSRSQD